MTNAFDILAQTHQDLRTVVSAVPAGSWDLPTPCSQWSVTQVTRHAILDQLLFAVALGKAEQPAEDAFQPSPEHIADPAAFVGHALDVAAAAWASVDRADEAVTTPVPPHKLPAPQAALAAALDAGVHAWDIAVATGQPSPLTPEVAVELHGLALHLVDPLRPWGAYAEALDDDGSDPVATLLRYLGREPGRPNAG
ncbi:TIGR03086 family metal-binding protein [Phytomonospora sp. NPDC050363]|uniref:TIGR03086 family metal-binding protein n=1 Tax=Phytomonospora sp. NPDC050363 TaxID=3155642 RepID=UPI0033D1A00E